MKSLDDARREASLAALAKARLRQAEEHRLARAAEVSAERVRNGSKANTNPIADFIREFQEQTMAGKPQPVVRGEPHLRRCLNPDCGVWFATRLPKANWCCEECLEAKKNYESRSCVSNTIFIRHAILISKRNAGIFDHPKPTPYAKALIAKVDAGVSAIDDVLHAASVQADRRAMGLGDFILTGVRQRGFTFSVNEPSSSYAEAWFLVGMDISAAFPNRPCDHSGFTILHSYSR